MAAAVATARLMEEIQEQAAQVVKAVLVVGHRRAEQLEAEPLQLGRI